MTALAIGNELYLSSSVKGGSFIYYEKNKDNPLYQCLVQCQIQFAAAGGDEAEEHKNGASCVSPAHLHSVDCHCQYRCSSNQIAYYRLQGECMTGYAYFQDHPDAKDLSGGYWATVKNSDQDNLAFENIEMFDPCELSSPTVLTSSSPSYTCSRVHCTDAGFAKIGATEYLGEDNPAQFGCAQLAKTINCTPVTKKDFKEVSLDENSITFSQPHLQCTVSEPQRKKRALEIAA